MQCNICELRCNLDKNRSGRCNMYINKNNKIVEKFPNSYLFTFPISIETQPMLHFYPQHKFLQISSIGCNFKCKGCVSEIFTKESNALSQMLKEIQISQIIDKAKQEQCIGITFGINDPIVSYYTFKNLAEVAKQHNLLVGFSSNLYFTEEALLDLINYIDFVNVGVKGFSDEIYKQVCRVSSSSFVFRNIKILKEHNIYFEVSIPYIKTKESEIFNVAKFLTHLSKNIPLQIMRFIPFGEAEIDLEPTIKESEHLIDEIKQYLNYVYLFNSPGTAYLNTNTNGIELEREFYGPMGAHVIKCKQKINTQNIIVGNINKTNFDEPGFFGGYRITRALEMIIGILNAIGVYDSKTISAIFAKILHKNNFMMNFHTKLDTLDSTPYDYLNIIDYLSKLSNNKEKGTKLIDYITNILDIISHIEQNIDNKIKSYYVMGYPLFALNGGRFECSLTEFVGCENTNRLIKKEGKPGVNITPHELNMLNPDIVFISGFLSLPEHDFMEYCINNNITINAVKTKKIYRLPVGWDFGNLTWILGLIFIANIAYPQYYNFDIEHEANSLYKTFYNEDYNINKNRSFYLKIETKP